MTTIRIECRDPVVSRDGRPFGAEQGNKMRSLVWPLPSVVAGSLRTAIGKSAEKTFTAQDSRDLFELEVSGLFPVTENSTLYLPSPNDCFHHESKPLAVEPQRLDGGGCDLPEGLFPVMLSLDQANEDSKPKPVPSWWPIDEYAKWLIGEPIDFSNGRYLLAPEPEERTHVKMDAKSGAGEEGQLFSTAALPLTHLPRYGAPREKAAITDRFAAITLTTRAEATGWCGDQLAKLDTLHPLGGERRLVHWKKDDAASLWKCPDTVRAKLSGATHVRMVLASPAIFAGGWKPSWLDDAMTGEVPGTNVKLKLVGFTIQRWKAISGWSLAPPRGPKAVRRMVPAGGVYFFKVVAGDPSTLADRYRWLQSVCDTPQDRRDGFGLACWGTWKPKENF